MSLRAMIRTGHVAVKYKDCMLIWGGYKEAELNSSERYLPSEDLWVYNPKTESWFVKKCHGRLPSGTSGCSAVVLNDNMYIFGGYRDNGNSNELYVLNLITSEWSLVASNDPVPIPSDKLVGWQYQEKLFFFGGFGFEPDTMESIRVKRARDFRFVPDPQSPLKYRRGWNNQFICYDPESKKWSCPEYKGEAPTARAAHAAAVVNNKVYIFGGRHQRSRINDLHCLDMETMTWSGNIETLGNVPCGRSWHSLTVLNDTTLVLYGGFSQLNEALDDCWHLNLQTFTWTQIDLPFARKRLWHSACMVIPGEIIICGGCCGNILEQLCHEHSPELIVLRFTPKSLFRLSVDKVLQYQLLVEHFMDVLPSSISKFIDNRLRAKLISQSFTLDGS